MTPATFSFTGDTAETQEITIDVAPLNNMNGEIEFGVILFDEDADQAPQAHFTTAIAGNLAEPAEAAIDETDFTILLEEGESGSASFNISNVADGDTVEDLTYSIDEAAPATVVLSSSREADPPQNIELAADGFTGSFNGIGVADQSILWFNQLTPGPTDIPFDLEGVALIDGEASGVLAGDVYDVYVWSDPDRIPGNGDEVLLSEIQDQTFGAPLAFIAVPLPAPVPITEETGDVLIGIVNRTRRADTFPARGEDGSPYQNRAYIAFNFPGGEPADPPVIANAATFGTIADLNPALARNWVIRGFGTGGSACLTPSDVPWLTVTPASGSVAAGESQEVVIDVDTTGLAQGSFEARVCVNTNDPNNPVFVLPVTVEVTEAGGLPTIDVAPETVDTTVSVLNPTGSETLDISNTGSALDLEWTIAEAESIAAGSNLRVSPAGKGAQPIVLGALDGSRTVDSAAVASIDRAFRGSGDQQLISVDGVTTGGDYDSGDPDNSTQSVAIGANAQVIGVGWEVTIETFGASWLSESSVAIVTNQSDEEGFFLNPGAGDNSAGTADYSSEGILVFADVTPDPIPPVVADGSGNVFLEWFESFDDAPGPDSNWSDSSAPVTLPAGLTLLVETLGAGHQPVNHPATLAGSRCPRTRAQPLRAKWTPSRLISMPRDSSRACMKPCCVSTATIRQRRWLKCRSAWKSRSRPTPPKWRVRSRGWAAARPIRSWPPVRALKSRARSTRST